MKKLLIILLSALSLSALAQKPKIAVYMTGDDPINEIVSSRLVDDFARGNEYTTVERTASFLSELSKEHYYERSGEVDDEQIAALGRQFNVQYVCVASILDVWGGEKYITARIIDVETAEIVASCSSNGSIQNSTELIGALNTLSENFFQAMRYTKQSNAKKVAVYVTKTGNRDVDVVLGDQLVAGFARSGRYAAIERTRSFLKKVKDEELYQHSGAVDDDDLSRWGSQFGVNYVCVTKTTEWSGDYFITTRMVDVKTGEVVNSYKIEGKKMGNSRDVLRVAQEIAAELSKGTLAEQAEEARLKAEEEARIRAEEERKIAEEEAKKKAEQERIQKQIDEEIAYIDGCIKKGYLELKTSDGHFLIDLNFDSYSYSFKEVNKVYSKYGKDGWRLPLKNEFYGIIYAFDSFYKLCLKHKKTLNISQSRRRYWCINGKVSWYYFMEYYNDWWDINRPDQDHDFTYAFQDWHVKSSVNACAIYVIKLK